MSQREIPGLAVIFHGDKQYYVNYFISKIKLVFLFFTHVLCTSPTDVIIIWNLVSIDSSHHQKHVKHGNQLSKDKML